MSPQGLHGHPRTLPLELRDGGPQREERLEALGPEAAAKAVNTFVVAAFSSLFLLLLTFPTTGPRLVSSLLEDPFCFPEQGATRLPAKELLAGVRRAIDGRMKLEAFCTWLEGPAMVFAVDHEAASAVSSTAEATMLAQLRQDVADFLNVRAQEDELFLFGTGADANVTGL